jgi:hypothetical protein
MAQNEVILKVKTDTTEANDGLEQVKKNTEDTGDAAKEAAGNFSIMGVSLNGVKAAFGKIIPLSKAMFGSIKAGLISTGIGAFVIAIGSLISYFTNTKKGAEQLQRIFKGFGAAVAVLTDRFSAVGETIVNAFSNPKEAIIGLWNTIKENLINRIEGTIDQFKAFGKIIKSAIDLDFDGVKEGAEDFASATLQVATGMDEVQRKNFANTVKEITTEIKNETNAAIELAGALQKIKDAEREFSIQKAKTAQEIQKARFEALDENKTLEERLEALQRAADLEIETTNKAIQLQKEKLAARQAEVDLGESLEEDYDDLAQLEVELINLQTSSFQTRKRIATEIETLTREQAALDKQAAKEKADADKAAADAKKKLDEEELKRAKEKAKAQKQVLMMGLKTAQNVFGKESAAGKAAAIAQATINTYEGASKAIADFGVPLGLPFAAIAIATGLKQVSAITSVEEPKFAQGGIVGGVGTSTSDSVSARLSKGESVINARSTRMFKPLLSAINEAGGGRSFVSGEGVGGTTMGVVKAFVVADDMTKQQDKMSKIRRKATI